MANTLVDAAGPLAGMWRSVYRKAAEAAEARLQTLLHDHVLHLHGRRAVAVVLSGGGGPLAAGVYCDLELPWGYLVEGWGLYADAAGDLELDLRLAADFAAFPATMSSICGGAPPALAGAQKAQAGPASVADWTRALPRGSVLRVAVVDATALTLATLTLYVRAA